MGKIQIGKVAFTHEGRYSSSKAYARNTCVTYNGSTYVSIKDVPADHAPDDSGIWWRLMASKGDKGDKGVDGTVAFGTLTADQKLQLKGEKGEKGDTGDTGPKGDKGEPGDMFFLRVNDDGDLVMDTIEDESYADLFTLNSNGDLIVNL